MTVDSLIDMSDAVVMTVTSRYEHSEDLLTATEIVQEFPKAGFTAQKLRRWAREGLIAVVRYPSGRVHFRRSDVEALLIPRMAPAVESTGSAPSASSPASSSGGGR